MTTLSISRSLVAGLSGRETRQGPLRALLARMAEAARADSVRRATLRMSDHMLRDIGLTRGDLDAL